jgi:ABC-type multidrug transport system fused ATPase/permease subunit
LSYRYPGSDGPAIENVTLAFAPRTLTAIAGDSGAGKSTLIALLLRLIEPSSGDISMNGRDAHGMSGAEWRQHFAFVPQRPHFLHGSILENLRMGNPYASESEVHAASRLAHAETFILALPHQYDSVIDDSGSTLSGGERQRLALARALLKPAPILVLDEPTSSLDAATEALIAETLQHVRRDRTVIAVTHRHLIIRSADHVICLDNGRVASDTERREVA